MVEFDQVATLETLLNTNVTKENDYELRSSGRIFSLADRQAQGASAEYTIRLGLKNSLLNGEHVLPVSKLSDIHIECFLNTGVKCLFGTDGSPTFNISDIELLLSYISSPSIQSHLNSNPISFHITDVTHRYNPVVSQETNVRLSSNHNSLNSITTLLRTEANLASADYQGKYTRFYDGSNHSEYNTLVNGRLLYEEPIDTATPEQFQIVSHAHNEVLRATYFNDFEGEHHLISDSLKAARHFSTLISGERTVGHNSDIIQRVRLNAIPNSPVRCDSFLYSDIRVYATGPAGDLKVEY